MNKMNLNLPVNSSNVNSLMNNSGVQDKSTNDAVLIAEQGESDLSTSTASIMRLLGELSKLSKKLRTLQQENTLQTQLKSLQVAEQVKHDKDTAADDNCRSAKKKAHWEMAGAALGFGAAALVPGGQGIGSVFSNMQSGKINDLSKEAQKLNNAADLINSQAQTMFNVGKAASNIDAAAQDLSSTISLIKDSYEKLVHDFKASDIR